MIINISRTYPNHPIIIGPFSPTITHPTCVPCIGSLSCRNMAIQGKILWRSHMAMGKSHFSVLFRWNHGKILELIFENSDRPHFFVN